MVLSVFLPIALALTISTHVASAVPAGLSLETAARVVTKETIVGTYSLKTASEQFFPNTGLGAGKDCPKSISLGPSVELPEGVGETFTQSSDAFTDVFGMSPDNWKISGNDCKSRSKSVYLAFSYDYTADSSSLPSGTSIAVQQLEDFEYSAAFISTVNIDPAGTTTPSDSTALGDPLKCGDETYTISNILTFEYANFISSNADFEGIFKRGESYLLLYGEVDVDNPADLGTCFYAKSESSSPEEESKQGESQQEESKQEESKQDGSNQEGSKQEESNDDSAACFPGGALVELKDGKTIAMESLRIGDQVKVAADHFSQVLFFTHRLSDGDFEFVSLRVASSSSKSTELQLSAGHYLSVNDQLKAAQSVEVGDVVSMGDGSSANVVHVSSVVSRGLFNPQTADGNIVVNGVVATTYTTAVKPAVAHSLLWPVRQLVRATGVTADLSCGMLEGRFAGFEVMRDFFASVMSWAI